MIRRPLFVLFLLSFLGDGTLVAFGPDPSTRIDRIAFGSCARQDAPQPIWKAVQKSDPDLFIWVGDNVYADTDDIDEMKAAYAKLAAIPEYQTLARSVPVIATWDDHDYGQPDGGAEFEFKETAKRLFLNFFSVPEDDPRRTRPGIHTSYLLGPPARDVRIILLDTRTFRSPLSSALLPRRYHPDPDPEKTMLGADQWRWLEQELLKPAAVRFIVSSVQVIADEHPYEKWGNLPLERSRLLDLVRRTGAGKTFFLSGDRHFAELSVAGESGRGLIHDLTSSSLNAPRSGLEDEPNRYRVGQGVDAANFGLITIDWSRPLPLVTLEIRDELGRVRLSRRVSVQN